MANYQHPSWDTMQQALFWADAYARWNVQNWASPTAKRNVQSLLVSVVGTALPVSGSWDAAWQKAADAAMPLLSIVARPMESPSERFFRFVRELTFQSLQIAGGEPSLPVSTEEADRIIAHSACLAARVVSRWPSATSVASVQRLLGDVFGWRASASSPSNPYAAVEVLSALGIPSPLAPSTKSMMEAVVRSLYWKYQLSETIKEHRAAYREKRAPRSMVLACDTSVTARLSSIALPRINMASLPKPTQPITKGSPGVGSLQFQSGGIF